MARRYSNEDIFAAVDRAHTLVEEGTSVRRALAIVARDMGVGVTTVWDWTRKTGKPLTPSEHSASKTAAAIRAHVASSHARRVRAISRALDAIDEALEVTVDPAGIKDLMVALGIAIDKARLESDEATERAERTERGDLLARPSRPERDERDHGRVA